MGDSVRNSSAKSKAALGPDDIQRAGKEILSSYQHLEAVWMQAEAKLALSHVPEDVQVHVGNELFGQGEDPDGEIQRYLGYCKAKNERRIFLIEKTKYWEEQGSKVAWTPITEASVFWRMEMVKHFPALYREIVAVTQRYAAQIKARAEELSSTLELLDL